MCAHIQYNTLFTLSTTASKKHNTLFAELLISFSCTHSDVVLHWLPGRRVHALSCRGLPLCFTAGGRAKRTAAGARARLCASRV